jgi:hypothetical protein
LRRHDERFQFASAAHDAGHDPMVPPSPSGIKLSGFYPGRLVRDGLWPGFYRAMPSSGSLLLKIPRQFAGQKIAWPGGCPASVTRTWQRMTSPCRARREFPGLFEKKAGRPESDYKPATASQQPETFQKFQISNAKRAPVTRLSRPRRTCRLSQRPDSRHRVWPD